MKKIALALVGLSMLWACNNSPAQVENSSASTSENSESLKKEVMELHDKVMPQMTPMSKLQGQLMQASVGRADSIDIMTAATELKYAKEAMMVWMREFSSNFEESWSEEEKVAFFKSEKMKMERIDSKTTDALAAGNELLAKLEAQTPAQDSASAAE
ncbi:hypothetical protein [Croceimicrobium hydrocarbonivorans]|uniref:Viral A-type inclusion protein n=1 Tax=Croceimicrobium hydrocarbonivorans TaxID=2761580 RepID=A0A7H0VAJ0_9FLAO|nr:hypothetical protein [Croceimicrobium hydrocarbonivorans]QNR22738.1 hypothetical protein H4K34_10125 [Croceimicrobium hydrocarbonivorans]